MAKNPEMRYIKPYIKLYNKMHKKLDKSYHKFEKDVQAGKSNKVLVKDQKELFLLLGELNYLTMECKKRANIRLS